MIPQTVWPHWRVLTVTVKARCSIEVVSSVSGQFPVNFHAKWLLWHVHVHFDCARSHKTMAAWYASDISLAHSTQNGCDDMSMCISTAQARAKNETSHTKILPRGRLSRDFAKRPLLEILFRDLAKRPLTEIFPTELLERSCTRSCQETSHSDLVQRPGEESSGLPGRSCIDSLNRDLTLTSLRDLLWRFLIERSLQEYCQETSYRDHHVQRSWQNTSFGDLAQRNCRDICWDLAKRPPTEIFQTELL